MGKARTWETVREGSKRKYTLLKTSQFGVKIQDKLRLRTNDPMFVY